jgi:CHASE2 domain-containing sensor protein
MPGAWGNSSGFIFSKLSSLTTAFLKRKSSSYWISALIVLVLSFIATPYVYDFLHLAQMRAELFQYLFTLQARPLEPSFVRVVIIDDEQFWNGYPAGRTPIKRDYLSTIIDRVASANPQVIVLDFDLRLSDPSSPRLISDYKNESEELISSILHAADTGIKIVLARTIRYGASASTYALDPDLQELFGICAHPHEDASWDNPGVPGFPTSDEAKRNITCGYIGLPKDILSLPVPLPLDDNEYIDSLALAAVRAANPNRAAHIKAQTSYSGHIPDAIFDEYGAKITADKLFHLPDGDIRSMLRGKTVIIAAGWSRFAHSRGELVDLHNSPIGKTTGAYLHANYVEAFHDRRAVGGLSRWITEASEAILGIMSIMLFAIFDRIWLRLVVLLGLSIVVLICMWFFLVVKGTLFDLFVPLLGLWLHSIYERLLGEPDEKKVA